jgi:hypothetical protein
MTTTVISLKGHIHDYGPQLEHAPAGLVYVGRAQTMGGWKLKPTPLANPHDVFQPKKPKPCRSCAGQHTREQAITLYRAHLTKRPDLLALIPGLRGRTLACWCAPNACHADVLAEIAEHAHLVDCCPDCSNDTIPHQADRTSPRWTVCDYLCQQCGKRWSCGWDPTPFRGSRLLPPAVAENAAG